MLFLGLLAVAYLLLAIVAVLMVLSAIDNKSFRVIFIVLGLVMPFIFLYAAATSLFARKPMPRFDEDMAKVEDDIETERLRIFGGERTCPSFGDRWERMYQIYLRQLVQQAARTSEKIASIGTNLHHGSGFAS
jgi:hypothetical protein